MKKSIDQTGAADFNQLKIGDWVLSAGTHILTRGTDSKHLEPKEISVLLHLAEHAPDLVTTESLLARSWPSVVVVDNVVHKAIAKLRKALGDNARKPHYIETLPKVGYRLVAPVVERSEAAALRTRGPSGPGPQTPPGGGVVTGRWSARTEWSLSRAGIVMIGLGLVVFLLTQWPTSEPESIPQIGVMPFTDLSDRNNNGAAHIVSQGIATRLHDQGWKVSILDASDRASDYLLAGDLRTVAQQAQVAVRLVDAQENLVWSDSFEFPTVDGELQAQPGNVAARIGWELTKHVAESARNKDPSERTAFEYYCLGMSESYRPFGTSSEQELQQAIATAAAYLDRALVLNQDMWQALTQRAKSLLDESYLAWPGSGDKVLRAMELTGRAIRINGQNEHVNRTHVRALWSAGKHEQATAHLLWFAVNNESSSVLYQLALLQVATMHLDEAEATLDRAVELNLEPNPVRLLAGIIALSRGDYENASAALRPVVQEQPNRGAYSFAIAALVRAGYIQEATEMFARYRAQFPHESPKNNVAVHVTLFPHHADMVAEGFEAAGWDGVI